MNTEHESPLYQAVYAAALVDELGNMGRLSGCSSAEFDLASQTARGIAEMAVRAERERAGPLPTPGSAEELRTLVLRFCAGIGHAIRTYTAADHVQALLDSLGMGDLPWDSLRELPELLRAHGITTDIRGTPLE